MRQLLFLTILLLAGVLQVVWGGIFGWYADFMIATLATLAFFTVPWETVACSFVAVTWLSWRPDSTREIIIIALLPIIWALASKYIPVNRRVLHSVAVISSITLFYWLIDSSGFFAVRGILLWDIAVSLAFAYMVYYALYRTYMPSGKGRMTLYGQLLYEGRRNRV